MPHVFLPERDDLSLEARVLWDARVANDGEITNMKRTLLHAPVAYDALMTWFPLRDALLPRIGERGVIVFSHAISTTNDCLLCSLYFRRTLLARGEDPEARYDLNAEEADLAEFGRSLAADGRASDELTGRLRERYGEDGLVELVAFAGLMAATNLVNTALGIDLDSELLALHTAGVRE
ncbi:hypothetical protein [Propionicicella superfundia]|uniref:hypothetical protein n=1 Tax=Propionicicella superfundia TaxID=348582 RepID=UPI000408C0C8|nr:hypothetical protein [Propionicicella superfundia]